MYLKSRRLSTELIGLNYNFYSVREQWWGYSAEGLMSRTREPFWASITEIRI